MLSAAGTITRLGLNSLGNNVRGIALACFRFNENRLSIAGDESDVKAGDKNTCFI